MSVNNVYNQAKINAVKSAMASQAKKTVQAQKPEYMKMTGSIFNAPGVKDSSSTTKTASTLTDLNTRKSISRC